MTRAQVRRLAQNPEHRRKMLAVRHAPKGEKTARHKVLVRWMTDQLKASAQ